MQWHHLILSLAIFIVSMSDGFTKEKSSGDTRFETIDFDSRGVTDPRFKPRSTPNIFTKTWASFTKTFFPRKTNLVKTAQWKRMQKAAKRNHKPKQKKQKKVAAPPEMSPEPTFSDWTPM